MTTPFGCGPNPCEWPCTAKEPTPPPTPDFCLIHADYGPDDALNWTIGAGNWTIDADGKIRLSDGFEATCNVEAVGKYNAAAIALFPRDIYFAGPLDITLKIKVVDDANYMAVRYHRSTLTPICSTMELIVNGAVVASCDYFEHNPDLRQLGIRVQYRSSGKLEAFFNAGSFALGRVVANVADNGGKKCALVNVHEVTTSNFGYREVDAVTTEGATCEASWSCLRDLITSLTTRGVMPTCVWTVDNLYDNLGKWQTSDKLLPGTMTRTYWRSSNHWRFLMDGIPSDGYLQINCGEYFCRWLPTGGFSGTIEIGDSSGVLDSKPQPPYALLTVIFCIDENGISGSLSSGVPASASIATTPTDQYGLEVFGDDAQATVLQVEASRGDPTMDYLFCEECGVTPPSPACQWCQTGTTPTTIMSTKTGISGFNNCADLNGTHPLTQDPADPCKWTYNHGTINNVPNCMETLTYYEQSGVIAARVSIDALDTGPDYVHEAVVGTDPADCGVSIPSMPWKGGVPSPGGCDGTGSTIDLVPQ